MTKDKNTNLISDEQLLRFADAIELGASFDQAFSDAGFSPQNKKERSELEKFFAMEEKFKTFKKDSFPSSVLAENIWMTLQAASPSPLSVSEPVILGGGIKSPYAIFMDRMVHTASGLSWKVGAPIAVLFLTLSTMLGMNAKRDAAVVASPEAPISSRTAPVSMAMNVGELNVKSQDAIPSETPGALAKNTAPLARTTLMRDTGTETGEADTTPQTLDGVLAMLYDEADRDQRISQQDTVSTTIDESSLNILLQPYDETTI